MLARKESADVVASRRSIWERALTWAEDGIYIVVAVALVGLAAVVVGSGLVGFATAARASELRTGALGLLNNVLLVLMLVEILHTVGISLRKHHLDAEPFLVVGLIAAIRRVLVITAEQGSPNAAEAVSFRLAMLELGLLTVLILALVAALIALSRSRGLRGSGQGRSPDRLVGSNPRPHEEGSFRDAGGERSAGHGDSPRGVLDAAVRVKTPARALVADVEGHPEGVETSSARM